MVSLALIDHEAGASWIVDATPDLPQQLDLLTAHAPAAPLAGLILTHAHIGHYTGLIHFGREVMGARGEFSDTIAILAAGPRRSLFYCPDIDRWETWDHDLPRFLAEIDVALLDGTFYSGAELPGRNLAEIPHPPVIETVARLVCARRSAGFIHLNHSNPLLRDGPELAALLAQGHWVGREGMIWEL